MPPADDRNYDALASLYATNREFRVEIAGRSFSTWEEVVVERAVDAACGSFAVNVVSPEQVSRDGRERSDDRTTRARLIDAKTGVLFQLPFGPQDEVSVRAGGELLITGRVDALEAELDKKSGTVLRLGGRDAAGDMVDCSALNKPGEWADVDLGDLARALAQPFGVPVSITGPVGPRIPLFKLHESETAWGALERACRMRGLLCFSDAAGGLLIESPGGGVADGSGAIRQGSNLLHAQLTLNDADRFSIYNVRGQQSATSGSFGDAALLVEANALDTGVRRYRPLVVLAEGAVSTSDAETRARWEAIVRATRAHRLRCTVPGWIRPRSSRLWRINTKAFCYIPTLGISAELVIVTTTFRRSRREGTTTELILARQDAFQPQPELSDADDALAPPASSDDEREGF